MEVETSVHLAREFFIPNFFDGSSLFDTPPINWRNPEGMSCLWFNPEPIGIIHIRSGQEQKLEFMAFNCVEPKEKTLEYVQIWGSYFRPWTGESHERHRGIIKREMNGYNIKKRLRYPIKHGWSAEVDWEPKLNFGSNESEGATSLIFIYNGVI